MLEIIGHYLNLKPFKVESKDGQIIDISFSLTAEVHRVTTPFKSSEILQWINPDSYLYHLI